MIKGAKIYLSNLERDNLEQLRLWRNNPELRQYFREYREISPDMQKAWYESRVLNNPNQVDFEIHDLETSKLIGHCGLYYINWTYRTGEFGIYLGDTDYRGKGYGSDSLKTLVKYGFDDLNLNRIWAEVYTNNTALDLYTHVGFKVEGVMRQTVYKNGSYYDSTMIGMLKSEYESLYK